jgi:hypothetical protein
VESEDDLNGCSNDDDKLHAAELALHRLRGAQCFEDWLLVGEALDIARRVCLEKSGAKKAFGMGYNMAMKEWLAAHPWFQKISAVSRQHHAEELGAELARRRVDQRGHLMGFPLPSHQ